MRITRLHLTNFRNYSDQVIEFDPGMNVFIGQNGQGKSAILEAAYVLAISKSHRTTRDGDLIRIGSDWSRIAADVDRDERGEVILEIILSRQEKKSVKINKVRHEKIGDIVGQLNAVIFSSADVDMVKSDPSARRRFMNLEVSQVSPQYVYSLGRYKRVLDQRNSILRNAKKGIPSTESLEVWDNQVVLYGSSMIEKRKSFVKRLSEIAETIYSRLSDGKEALHIGYESSVRLEGAESLDDIKQAFASDIARVRDNDIFRGTTTKGPHRDDISFKVNDMDVRYFGSAGQQKSVALAIKLAEIGLVEEMVGETPVVLLDDVGAELDDQRRAHLFDMTVGRCQTLVTATSLRELPASISEHSSVYVVDAGQVRTQ